jgi:hypothetical protein
MSKYIVKVIISKKPKYLIIWNGESTFFINLVKFKKL